MMKIHCRLSQLPQIFWFMLKLRVTGGLERYSSHPKRELRVLNYVLAKSAPNDPGVEYNDNIDDDIKVSVY